MYAGPNGIDQGHAMMTAGASARSCEPTWGTMLAIRRSLVDPIDDMKPPQGAPSTVSSCGYEYGTAGWVLLQSASSLSFFARNARHAAGPSA